MRGVIAVVCSWSLVFGAFAVQAQAPPAKLNIIIIEGEGAVNNIRARTGREPIVQVEDENHKPVAGAAVVFTLPSQGASGAFANGSRTLTVLTDNNGRAVARGLKVNRVSGKMEIHVNASLAGATGSAIINQTNILGAVAAGAAAGGISAKLIAILAIAGAAAAGGAYAATHTGNGTGTPGAAAGTVITPGTGTVGPPR
jgi:hypothetical protein